MKTVGTTAPAVWGAGTGHFRSGKYGTFPIMSFPRTCVVQGRCRPPAPLLRTQDLRNDEASVSYDLDTAAGGTAVSETTLDSYAGIKKRPPLTARSTLYFRLPYKFLAITVLRCDHVEMLVWAVAPLGARDARRVTSVNSRIETGSQI